MTPSAQAALRVLLAQASDALAAAGCPGPARHVADVPASPARFAGCAAKRLAHAEMVARMMHAQAGATHRAMVIGAAVECVVLARAGLDAASFAPRDDGLEAWVIVLGDRQRSLRSRIAG